MRKFLTYFFIALYLFSFQEVRQVVKLPNLVEHYFSHKLHNSSMSLFSFFKMHYLDEPVMDSDYKQDMKLPFKTHDQTVTLNPVMPPNNVEYRFEHKCPHVKVQQQFAYSEGFYPSVYLKIWQPPKI